MEESLTRVLVCGPRFYGEYRPGKSNGQTLDERVRVFYTLDDEHKKSRITTIIHGACMMDEKMSGADHWADEWAMRNGVPAERYPVDHTLDGPWPAAGPRRNRRMLETSKPDRGIAFMPPVGTKKSGTLGMVDLMERAGLDVLKVPE